MFMGELETKVDTIASPAKNYLSKAETSLIFWLFSSFS